jgi:tRNA dimethylallyltransferase
VTILVLTGPTGTGKSDWAVRLAETLPVEIVSVDSALVYRGLDIGTAKPPSAVRACVPHHLIDICDAAESYSAGRFVSDALACIAEIDARGRIPLLVGGTMLYFRALLQGIAPLPQASEDLRRIIDGRAAREGWQALHAELARLDPVTAARVHPNDPQRIQRALEVCYATGRPLSELQQTTKSAIPPERVRRWALVPVDRAAWHQRLEARFHDMMAQGFLDEVAGLYARGDIHARLPSMRAVGYRQLWEHLAGESKLHEAVQRGIAATRALAKRQLTWLRAEKGLERLDPLMPGAFERWRDEATASLSRTWPLIGAAC